MNSENMNKQSVDKLMEASFCVGAYMIIECLTEFKNKTNDAKMSVSDFINIIEELKIVNDDY